MKTKQTIKQLIIEKYSTINAFLEAKAFENNGKLPMRREYIYKIINHEIKNPGILTLKKLAILAGANEVDVFIEYSE